MLESAQQVRVTHNDYDPTKNRLIIHFQPSGDTRPEVVRYLIENEMNRLAKQFYKRALVQARQAAASSGDRKSGRAPESKPAAADPSLLKRLLEQAKREARANARAWQPPADWGAQGSIQMTTGPGLRVLQRLSSGGAVD